jgi:hypothetical protein
LSATRLHIRTKSIPTAAAVALLYGEEPRILRRHGDDVTFEFDADAQESLEKFLAMKQRIDDLVSGGRSA